MRAAAEGKRLGRPKLAVKVRDAAIRALQQGSSIRQAADLSGASVGAIAALRKEMLGQEQTQEHLRT